MRLRQSYRIFLLSIIELFISKGSLEKSLGDNPKNIERRKNFDNWLLGENEIFLVIDEAHHSTTKKYREIIEYVRQRV